jgi:hypothetical protein
MTAGKCPSYCPSQTYNFTIQENKMKSSRRHFGVVVLILMLTTPTLAGDIHTMIAPPPAPPATTTDGDMTTGVAGEITTGNADAGAVGGSVTDAALALIQSVLSLL